MANNDFHRNNWLTEGRGTAILVCRRVDHYAVPVQGLKHLEATAIQIMLGNKPVKILAVYLTPARPLIASDLSGLAAVFPSSWRVTNAKHLNWNSRLNTARVTLA